ncbi:conjugative transposon protein TraN [Zhouia spongiae]|uniref:Conjugative transposon protein TraN n=1 Tax=Zhouia spongiae TaxID=2202721 RepID=A0ABY3YL01_9FLAO|nr:DUF4138 domain-containing protein [Zhouia spongiae]UNY98327.1 conjugative transposon protein TraN [Zhouia spongiae]
MKPVLVKTIILLLPLTMWSQKALDTLYTNEYMNVALIFPSPIRQGITGSANFTFSYNREKPQHLGLLQGQGGFSSNLLVITQDGQVYSYYLKYKKNLAKTHYFISPSYSIGKETGMQMKVIKNSGNLPLQSDSIKLAQAYFKKGAQYYLSRHSAARAARRSQGIVLKMESLNYHKNQVYVVYQIKNNSAVDFQLAYLRMYKITGDSRKNASFQSLPLEPIYYYARPDKIRRGQALRFVYVYSKFVPSKDEKLLVELLEANGSRMIQLRD